MRHTDTKPLTGRERTRTWRERERAGTVLVTLLLERRDIDRLVVRGLLAEGERRDHAALARALFDLIDRPDLQAAPPPRRPRVTGPYAALGIDDPEE